ncbi:MAG: insulinase family protein [Firmicutes bacterium]|nr:insulinase family protein [Bacillota bacterium]
MIEIRKLRNGATMIMERTDFVRSAALGIWVRTGSSHESGDNSGVSHFIEHMMFKGTEQRNARQIAEAVDRIGGMSNAFTGKEATCYYIKTLSSNIYDGAEILLDMVTGSTFAEEEMNKERQVILEEIKMIRDTPDEDVIDMISELVNGKNAIGQTILGTPESLAGIDRQKLVDYYCREYSRDSIVIAAAGNFDPERLAALFEEGLDSLPADKPAFAPKIYPYEQQFQVRVKDIEQTHLCMAIPSVSLGDDRYYTFVLLSSIFGGSMSSRLFQNIREERGLAYSVASMNAFSSRSGFFTIYAGVAHEKLKETVEAIKYEIEKLCEDGVSEDELAMAKEQMKSSFIFGLENINSRMFNLGKNKLLLDRVFEADEVLQAYDAVTRQDILDAAQLIGQSTSYCGAAVTGREFDLEALVRS